ncbi:sterol carrier family protein [Streptomyces sp. H10-C2]|uniref:maleylpyruvate isomerase family mycothiol-dependent enzyme n=1 Tax=unclassified Streptomyces TaxID=2593676 RepID=UPI0024BAC63D|nr:MULTISPECIES: maleylpyruvate isomerase family mycothiol-dependent enzyme [unclassified Streptomyces]MDJ0344988.1 sterol carrier family protein [Streptomyces sp. PH10-H1]MDJ0373931.1 sterol carrier family protein [Streptomyces sp. H10-C2]
MTSAGRRARTYDPARTRAALIAQVSAVRSAVHALTPEQLALPAGLPGWDVTLLVAHIVRQIDAVPMLLGEPVPDPAPPVTDLSTWAVSTAALADRLDATTRETAAGIQDPAAAIDAAAARLEPVLDEAVRADRIVPHIFGAMRALDLTVTRLVELVVHGDDLARATGVEVAHDRQAVAAVTRLLADALAVKAPGNSVEVRIPPYAAVQCVAGPRHTRGTPANVVETDPITWIRLATGRTDWKSALEAADVSASGERADLAPYLPVLG